MSRATNTTAIGRGEVLCLGVIATNTIPAALPLVLEGIADSFAESVSTWAQDLPCHTVGARLVLLLVPAERYARVVDSLEHAPWWEGLYVGTVDAPIPRIIYGPRHAQVAAARANPIGVNVPLGPFAPAQPSGFRPRAQPALRLEEGE